MTETTARSRPRRLRLSLRVKLVALSLVLLVIPWIGYRYLNEIESFLRQQKEQTLLATASAVARVLHDQPALFTHAVTRMQVADQSEHLYVRSLASPIHLDGYADDWTPYRDRARRYGGGNRAGATWFDLISGTRDQYLYMLLEVHDDHVVYRQPGTDRDADHVELALQTPRGEFQRYSLSSTSPGWVRAQREDPAADQAASTERVIRGEWQENTDGYTLELRLPLSLLGDRLSLGVVDVDDPRARQVVSVVATAGLDRPGNLGTITVPSAAVDRLLRGLERQQGRIWIVDNQQRVLAMVGSLGTEDAPPAAADRGLLHGLYRLILQQPPPLVQDDLSDVSRLRSPEVNRSLQGEPATRWRRSPDGQTNIVSAAYPVWDGSRVIGAAVAEETSRDILLLQNRALEHLLNLSLAVFVIAAGLLLGMASRIAQRIRRLRDQAEGAIARDGRVVGDIAPSRAGDEIGDLSRSFAEMLQRLRQYTRYLETMAGKLSHELRTPLAVVRSSLDNLDLDGGAGAGNVYTERARTGLDRLEGIVGRMSEATRLEQAFQHIHKERFDFAALLSGCVAGYRSAHPERVFELQAPAMGLELEGVPDLLAQLLDKLVGNALDFGDPRQPIVIEASGADPVLLRVRNQGPPLPAEMEGSLFDSMVSVRSERSDEPHLGLGLYIVRLIAQYHGGRVWARNTQAPPGAEFLVELPAGRIHV